jgi:hypothetical protein
MYGGNPGGPSMYNYDPGLPQRERGGSDPLHIEKSIFMGIIGLTGVVGIVGMIAGAAMMPGELGAVGGAAVIGAIIGLLISLAIYYWVLFGDDAWPKWTCLGCQGIGLFSIVTTMCAGTGGYTPGDSPFTGWMTFFQVCWTMWFASIIYRDIQGRPTGS